MPMLLLGLLFIALTAAALYIGSRGNNLSIANIDRATKIVKLSNGSACQCDAVPEAWAVGQPVTYRNGRLINGVTKDSILIRRGR